MGSAYLTACQARDKEPVGLDAAMHYEYGNPDFAHGVVIPLFAPQPEWVDGFCHGIEDASHILDLDKGVLVVPNWTIENKDGSYDAGTLGILWNIDFAQVLDIEPASLQEALQKPDYDTDAAPAARASETRVPAAGRRRLPAQHGFGHAGLCRAQGHHRQGCQRRRSRCHRRPARDQ